LVLLAGDIRNASILVHPSVGGVRVATVAGTSITTVNHDLDGRDDISLSTVSGDLDTIGNGGHGSVGPARTTMKRKRKKLIRRRKKLLEKGNGGKNFEAHQ
jgi:hypothetical protein